jgi:hypothetical protein
VISKAEKEVDNESPTKLFNGKEIGAKNKGSKTDLSHRGRRDMDDYDDYEDDIDGPDS